MAKRDSFYDPLRPALGPLGGLWLYYEDRVLVRRLKWPAGLGPLAVDAFADPREGPQYGVVIAQGPGNSLFLFQCPSLTCSHVATVRLRPPGRRGPGDGPSVPPQKCERCGGAMVYRARLHERMETKPGDRVIYQRLPSQEFQADGDTFTFLFEEQHILGAVEG